MDWTISEFGRCVGLVRERRSLVGQAEMNLPGHRKVCKKILAGALRKPGASAHQTCNL